MIKPPPIGRLAADAIGPRAERIDDAIIAAYLALPDLTGNASDAMDLLNLSGAVGAVVLRPSIPSARIAGPALTVKNRARRGPVADIVASKDNRLGDIEAHNIALPGDILVVQGVPNASSLGGIMAAIAKRQGEKGIVVDGLVRDIESSRSIGLPVWAKGTTPVTGKWRVETEGVNVPVVIAGVNVAPGDLVLADETGVCFVPRADIERVLQTAQRLAAEEENRLRRINDGVALAEITAVRR
ncbi:RraA family protein [Microbacteriaceae bacterium K1510]|nr:RraA family protein [Microbacteriaceae bacterium K1510]